MSLIKKLNKVYKSEEHGGLSYTDAIQTVAEVVFGIPSLGFPSEKVGAMSEMMVDNVDKQDAFSVYVCMTLREVNTLRVKGHYTIDSKDQQEIMRCVIGAGSLVNFSERIATQGGEFEIDEFGQQTLDYCKNNKRYDPSNYGYQEQVIVPQHSLLPASGVDGFIQALCDLPQEKKDLINSMNVFAPITKGGWAAGIRFGDAGLRSVEQQEKEGY